MSQIPRREQMRRVGAMIPKTHQQALVQNANENGRTIAAEIRLALQEWLRKHGRLAS